MRPSPFVAALLLLALARGAAAEDPTRGAPSPPAVRVLAAITAAAGENAAAPVGKRLAGDALADLYVRRAAAAAEGDATAFLVALAHAFDEKEMLAKTPGTDRTFADLETSEARAARRKVMGAPTLRGRADWLAHFWVSAVLRPLAGDAIARAAGIAKEMMDVEHGGGFSFADLLADEAGISFARWLFERDTAGRLARVADSFTGANEMPDATGYGDGISKAVFARDYGGPTDPRFRAEHQRISNAVIALSAGRAGGLVPKPTGTSTWVQVGKAGEFPISGVALESFDATGARYLAVRDHPHPDGLWRITVGVDGTTSAATVPWPCGTQCPKDAEAISTVPGFPGHFVVADSDGRWFHVQIAADGSAVTAETGALDVTAVPAGQELSLEGFTLQALGGGKDYVAVWGNRGRGVVQAGLLAWAPVTVTATKTGGGCTVAIAAAAGTEKLSLPEPLPDDAAHRHVAELKLVSSGVLWGVSSRKPADPKEFASAVYVLGTMAVRAGAITFQRAQGTAPLWSYVGHKIEAMEIAPDGGFLFGADDESEGGRLLRVP